MANDPKSKKKALAQKMNLKQLSQRFAKHADTFERVGKWAQKQPKKPF